MQNIVVLAGPGEAGDTYQQIVALAESLGFRLVAASTAEDGTNRLFDPTPLEQCATLPPRADNEFWHDIYAACTLADIQQRTMVDAWDFLHHRFRVRPRSPYRQSAMFREVSAAMTARGLRFADRPPVWPFYTTADWKAQYGVDAHLASVLVRNHIPDPRLLSELSDDQAWLEWAGQDKREAIKQLRDRLRRDFRR